MVTQAVTPLTGITTGCDPELFILDGSGRPVSAHGLIPGTKAAPFKVNNGAIQVDGMAAEFNTDPASTFEEFHFNINSVMGQLKKMLPKDHTLSCVPHVVFSKEVWDAAPEEAKELGCTPDFNAWTGEVNPPPSNPDNPTLRTASGHVHIGWCDDAELDDEIHISNCRDLVKQLDWYLGGWSLQKDPDPVRRTLYGKSGAMRYKPYGVEYRVLSNFWLQDKDSRLQMWNRLHTGINDMRKLFMPDRASNHCKFLRESIDKSERNVSLERNYRYPMLTLARG